MSAYNLPDYTTKYFQHKVLEKILGQPSIETIAKLFKQVKGNALKVPTTLGGGQLGYLALVLDPTEYITIPGAGRFLRPTDPGTFTPQLGIAAPTLTAAEITTQKLLTMNGKDCLMKHKQLKTRCVHKSSMQSTMTTSVR